MTAPTSTHDLTALADRLRRIQAEIVQISTEIATIAQAEASRPNVDGDADGAVYTPREAARLLGRSRSWVHDRIRDGTLPAIKVGSRYLCRRGDLAAGGWL